MAGGILGTGISGLLAAQRSLSIAGHNIANVNTDGYNRQRVDLSTRDPQLFGDGYVGTGVRVDTIRRVYDEFVTLQVRATTAGFHQAQEFYGLASQVDNLLADAQAGLMPAVQGFFDALQGVANDPASVPARQVLLSEGESLAQRFEYLDQRLTDLNNQINSALGAAIAEVNSLTAAIAGINRAMLTTSSGTSGAPNDLLDRRDELIRQLSEKVAVTTVTQDDGTVNVFVGSGQAVVVGIESRALVAANNVYDPGRKDVAYATVAGSVVISDQMSGGAIGGLLAFRSQVLDTAANALGHLALGLTGTFNAQHRLGLDLNGALGGDFFVPIDTSTAPRIPQVLPHNANTGLPAAVVDVAISDVNLLNTSDYLLERVTGVYTLTRLSDNTVTKLSTFPAAAQTVDGITLTLAAGSIADGDRFLIRPVRSAAQNFAVAINDTALIAAAGAVRTGSALANSGTGTIDAGTLTSASAYSPDNYSIYAVAATAGSANGVIGTITDNNNDSTLQYELRVNGVLVYTQGEAAAPLADLNALAAAINGPAGANVAQSGVRAYVDAGAGVLYFANEPPRSLPISVTETLNTTAGVVEDGDTVTGYFGGALTGLTSPSNTVTYSGTADSYIVIDSSGTTETSGGYTSGAAIAFNGIRTAISGTPRLGDLFTVRPNTNGVGDNRNALALAGLQTHLTLNGSTASYEQVFSRMVADIGTKTRQGEINRDAQDVLLNRAIQRREEISGVNLDEEAADILRFQQAYQAAAQLIATADNMFQTLIDVVGR